MAEKKDSRVKDFTDTVEGFTGVVKGNYLNGLKLAISIWEENQKVLNAQVDQWLNFQKEYVKASREAYEKLPKEVRDLWNGNAKAVNEEVDRMIAFQKEYVETVRSISDKVAKETVSLTQKNVEKAFSLFDEYFGSLKV
jgi:hypothetical protein